MAGRLTAKRVQSLSRPGRYGDGGTLFLVVAPGGSKSWVQRLTIDGKRHDMGLGGYPLVTLSQARDEAFENRRVARKGGDPLAHRRRANVPCFRDAAAETYRANRSGWRSEKVAKSWQQRLERHVLPILGEKRLDRIGREDVLKVLVPLGPSETGRKVKAIIRQTLSLGIARGHLDTNVVDAVAGALPKRNATTRHYRALPYDEVPAALQVVDACGAGDAARRCLTFTVLTAARSGEARGATWDEIDMERRVWTVPAERMKAAAVHRVPLADAAVAVLERAGGATSGSGLVFESPRRPGRPLSEVTLTAVLRRCGLADRATVHGFRSSFRNWCAETGKPRELAEAALAHSVGGVEGAYFRTDLFDRRRGLMEAWGQFVSGMPADAVPPADGSTRRDGARPRRVGG